MDKIGVVDESSKGNYFKFISDQRLPKGSFVEYNEPKLENIPILSKIIDMSTLKSFPPEFLSPDLDPEEAAEMAGIDLEDIGKFEIEAKIIGYFREKTSEFVNPKIPPASGTPVKKASTSVLDYINKVEKEEENSAYIGKIIKTEKNVNLDISEIINTHISILASTGSGKSYTVGVLIEEMLKEKNGASVLILDPHGEYSTLKDLENKSLLSNKEVINKFKYPNNELPDVKVFNEDDIQLKISDLEFDDLAAIIDDGSMSEKMRHYLQRAYNKLKRKNFNQEEIRDKVLELKDKEGNYLKDHPLHSSSIEGILWRLEKNILNKDFFQNYTKLGLNELLSPKKASILDLSGIKAKDQQLLSSVILRKIFESRKMAVKGENKTNITKVPHPVFIVIEEGHRFAPNEGRSKSKNVLKTVLSEGRKFGIGVCLVSQRPSKLDTDSLSQCMSQITMKIINPYDQNKIKESIESVGKDIVDRLPSLSTGEAIISGSTVNTPVNIEVRKRITRHGGKGVKNPSKSWKNNLKDNFYDKRDKTIQKDKETKLFSNENQKNK
ncbi:MAG: HerA helicase [Candidatus Methanohalarchaeum thermophilum]|uniref:HerA helicase n=1 Tax=Methanohalarchaeum thermophilum TaxID=1903181 RepID=A0A1Q6DUH6_METT1|nr:MAG: HerA helicase [Candidatus Methanohalarchaeum thermophilum]